MIARARTSEGTRILDKTLASVVGVSPGQFSRKIHMTGESKFTVEEFGALADFFQAPPGWPFISIELAEQMHRALDRLGLASK